LATASITGDAVRVQKDPTGPAVYTTADGQVLMDKYTKQNFDTDSTLIKDTCKKAFGYAPKAIVTRIEKQFCLGEGCQQLNPDGSVKVVAGGIIVNEYLWKAYSSELLSKGGGGGGSKIVSTDIPYSYSENEMGVQGILCCK